MRKFVYILLFAIVATAAVASNVFIYAPREAGTNGQILVAGGPGVAPQWKNGISKQDMIDISYPVGYVWVQRSSSDDPTIILNKAGEYETTWTNITETISNRFFRADSTVAVATFVEEEIPSITLNSVTHDHGPGTWRITGHIGPFCEYVTYPSVWSSDPVANGAFTVNKNLSTHAQGVYYGSNKNTYGFKLNAANGWSGFTDWNGIFKPTVVENTIYKTSATHIVPLATTVKVWKRVK